MKRAVFIEFDRAGRATQHIERVASQPNPVTAGVVVGDVVVEVHAYGDGRIEVVKRLSGSHRPTEISILQEGTPQ
jgi:hypothetical protein